MKRLILMILALVLIISVPAFSAYTKFTEIQVGGGYGSTGANLTSAGVGQFNGAFTADGAGTFGSLVCTAAATFGGGYGSTGATISTTGIGQFNGALTTDGLITSNTIASTQTVTSGYGLYITRNLAAASTDSALVYILNSSATDDKPALSVRQNTTAQNVIEAYGSTNLRWGVTGIGAELLTTAATTTAASTIDASTVTSGDGLLITTADTPLNGGFYFRCVDENPNVDFSIGESGNTVIAGTLGVSGTTTLSGLAAGPGTGTIIYTKRVTPTVAEVHAGYTVVSAVSGRKIRLVDYSVVAVGGNVATQTHFYVKGTQSAGAVNLVDIAAAALTRAALNKPWTASNTLLVTSSDLAALNACDANTAITLGDDAQATTATSFIVDITYAVD